MPIEVASLSFRWLPLCSKVGSAKRKGMCVKETVEVRFRVERGCKSLYPFWCVWKSPLLGDSFLALGLNNSLSFLCRRPIFWPRTQGPHLSVYTLYFCNHPPLPFWGISWCSLNCVFSSPIWNMRQLSWIVAQRMTCVHPLPYCSLVVFLPFILFSFSFHWNPFTVITSFHDWLAAAAHTFSHM